MRGFTIGVLVCGFVGCLLWGVTGGQTSAAPGHVDSPTELQVIAMPAAAGDVEQELVLVDARNRRIGVYQINRSSGHISLKSVRNIQWDLQLSAFNEQSPAPQEVRAMLERN